MQGQWIVRVMAVERQWDCPEAGEVWALSHRWGGRCQERPCVSGGPDVHLVDLTTRQAGAGLEPQSQVLKSEWSSLERHAGWPRGPSGQSLLHSLSHLYLKDAHLGGPSWMNRGLPVCGGCFSDPQPPGGPQHHPPSPIQTQR
jgi:hypothetical protein